jgi:hypothetical protein
MVYAATNNGGFTMWLCFNDAYLSIVDKDCKRDEVMVRARRRGDIQRVFPDARVTEYTKSDYLFRAPIKRVDVIKAFIARIMGLDYSNFKDSVLEDDLHDAYMRIWYVMASLQETKPYSGFDWTDYKEAESKKKQKKDEVSPRRRR